MKFYLDKKSQAYEAPQAECLDLQTNSAFLSLSGGVLESIGEDEVGLDLNY